jgi:hypothetical protein
LTSVSITPQHALYQHGKPVDAFAHIGIAERQTEQRHDICS